MTKSARAVSAVVVGALLVLLDSTAGAQGPAPRRPQQVPSTGVELPLTPADTIGIRNLDAFTNRSTDGLTFEHRGDGTIGLDLQGRFQNVMLANRLPDGSIALNCVAESNDRTAFSIPQWTPDRQAPVRRIAAPSKLAAPIVVAPKTAPVLEVK